MAPYQCEKCWFVNLCGRCPDLGSLEYIQTLAVQCRANLDIFWNCGNSTVHGSLGYAKDLASRASESVRVVPLPSITVWPVGDEVVMGVAIHMLEK